MKTNRIDLTKSEEEIKKKVFSKVIKKVKYDVDVTIIKNFPSAEKIYLKKLNEFRRRNGLGSCSLPKKYLKEKKIVFFSTPYSGLAIYWDNKDTCYETMAWNVEEKQVWAEDDLKWYCIHFAKVNGFKWLDMPSLSKK